MEKKPELQNKDNLEESKSDNLKSEVHQGNHENSSIEHKESNPELDQAISNSEIHRKILASNSYHAECQFSVEDIIEEDIKVVVANSFPSTLTSNINDELAYLQKSHGNEAIIIGLANINHQYLKKYFMTDEKLESSRLILVPDESMQIGGMFTLMPSQVVVFK